MADDVIYLNFNEGVQRVMNQPKIYIKFITKFKTENTIKELEDTLSAGDMEKARIAAHTLKGTSANLSLTELYKQSLEIETQIKAGNVKPDQFSIVKDVFNKTLTEIDKVISQNA
jgi:HPt (histidine-containing phosphotransfer) domain-containing protein